MKKHLFRHSYRNRLFAAMFLASLVPLLICTILTAQITRLQMDRSAREDCRDQSAVLLQVLDAVSSDFESAVSALNQNDLISSALKSESENLLAVNSDLFSATDIARNYAVFDLYSENGQCRYSTQDGAASGSLPTDWGILKGAASDPENTVYFAAENPSDLTLPLLTAARQLQSSDGEDCGFLVMRLFASGFHTLTDGKYVQCNLMILSPFFRPVFSSQTHLNTTLAPDLRRQLLSGQALPEDQFLYAISKNEATGLYIVLQQPRIFNAETIRLLYSAGLLCAMVCLVISVFVSLALSRQISAPIGRMHRAFDRLQQGDLETQLPPQDPDELGQLAGQFNEMVAALKVNRTALLRNQQELNEAQIRMLQAQLNPHFLCNTLDTMKWISKINKVPQVALMSTDLADILRFCISSEEFVPLYREIEILERYIEIQRIRLSDDFSFVLQVNEELYGCLVPKMILQPIVENAIVHGLSGVENSCITVTADYLNPHRFRITVTDNGKGFAPEMIGRPYHGDKALAKGHLGLYNVDTILRRFYGEECGLHLDCGPEGRGASVTAELPVRYEEESEC